MTGVALLDRSFDEAQHQNHAVSRGFRYIRGPKILPS
jgi:hypothetical protein